MAVNPTIRAGHHPANRMLSRGQDIEGLQLRPTDLTETCRCRHHLHRLIRRKVAHGDNHLRNHRQTTHRLLHNTNNTTAHTALSFLEERSPLFLEYDDTPILSNVSQNAIILNMSRNIRQPHTAFILNAYYQSSPRRLLFVL